MRDIISIRHEKTELLRCASAVIVPNFYKFEK